MSRASCARVPAGDNGRTPYVDGIEVHEVPGDHDGMVLEPNVRVLAARIRACIEAVEAERRAMRAATR